MNQSKNFTPSPFRYFNLRSPTFQENGARSQLYRSRQDIVFSVFGLFAKYVRRITKAITAGVWMMTSIFDYLFTKPFLEMCDGLGYLFCVVIIALVAIVSFAAGILIRAGIGKLALNLIH